MPAPPALAECSFGSRADARKTAALAWSKAETERQHHAAATQSTLAAIDASSHDYATANELAAAGLDTDPDATDPHSQTIRGLLGNACAGCQVRPTSVELYAVLRADNPTRRQRSIATVLINEASFEDLVKAHKRRSPSGTSPKPPTASAAYRHCGPA